MLSVILTELGIGVFDNDKCVKSFSSPEFLIAATVSPPPTIDIKDFDFEFSEILFAID